MLPGARAETSGRSTASRTPPGRTRASESERLLGPSWRRCRSSAAASAPPQPCASGEICALGRRLIGSLISRRLLVLGGAACALREPPAQGAAASRAHGGSLATGARPEGANHGTRGSSARRAALSERRLAAVRRPWLGRIWAEPRWSAPPAAPPGDGPAWARLARRTSVSRDTWRRIPGFRGRHLVAKAGTGAARTERERKRRGRRAGGGGEQRGGGGRREDLQNCLDLYYFTF